MFLLRSWKSYLVSAKTLLREVEINSPIKQYRLYAFEQHENMLPENYTNPHGKVIWQGHSLIAILLAPGTEQQMRRVWLFQKEKQQMNTGNKSVVASN